MSKQTLSILTNKEMIAIDQDPLVYQARKLKDYDRSEKKQKIPFNIDSLGLNHDKGYVIHKVWEKTTSQTQYKPIQEYEVEPHGIMLLRIKGISRPYNVFQNFFHMK